MIPRQASGKLLQLAQQFRAVAILGPRQSGKTTLAKACFPEKPYVSLETPTMRRFALEDPVQFLRQYPDGAIFDEIQRAPELLSWLQQDLDETPSVRGKFVLTGSNNLLLLENITQTLAGRIAHIELLPFSVAELQALPEALSDINTLLWKGGYPPVQADGIGPEDWFSMYIRTYVERDVRQIKNIENLLLFERFLSLCAGRVGQEINYSALSNELGVDRKTIQSWLGILQASYLVYLLPPFYNNFQKRVLKTPKLYFFDTGLVCALLQISQPNMLSLHPFRGALFENFIVTELIKNRFNQGKRSNLYFWRESSGNELDVILDEGLRQFPIEIKSGQTIQSAWTKGILYWQQLSGQSGGLILHGGNENQRRSGGIDFLSWEKVAGL
ncbi:MAG: ATP-binding protein [Chitinophagales bacterium]|nr:ATP-binding protein [Chitinophagales bacterium]